jgi:CubicO group peptidase (beta-lactamase class C family)
MPVLVDAQPTEPDYWPTTGWLTATPESQGLDSTWLRQMENYISGWESSATLRSVLIVRHGYLVYENYFSVSSRINQTRNIFSCTKSVTSALIGIAVSQGYLSIQDHMLDFFSHMTIDNLDARKQAVTVQDLLTMTSGLPWDEWSYPYTHPNNDWYRMTTSPDWEQFVIDRPMAYNPGEQWVYNTGGSHLLSAILAQATNMSTITFAETQLFTPLGITDYLWQHSPNGIENGGSGLELRPRDMAKFGFLYLHRGTWDGNVILPSSWVTASSSSQVTLDSETGYGYQWWIHPTLEAYAAHGYENQHIFVIPDHDIIVVITAANNNLDIYPLIENYILPSATIPAGSGLLGLVLGMLIAGGLISVIVVVFIKIRPRKSN